MGDRLPVLVWGASSQAAVVTDIFESGHMYFAHSYADDTDREHENNLFLGQSVFRNLNEVRTLLNAGIAHAIIAVGSIEAKIRLSEILLNIGFEFVNAIHQAATVSGNSQLGKGVIIKPGAVIDPLVKIESHVYIGSCATIGHDVMIGSYTNIVGGVSISGHVSIGSGTHIGTGATIKDRLQIGKNVIIGAGSVVTANIPDNTIARGVPARYQPR